MGGRRQEADAEGAEEEGVMQVSVCQTSQSCNQAASLKINFLYFSPEISPHVDSTIALQGIQTPDGYCK